MSTPVTFRDRVRYQFDNFMSRGGLSIFLALLTLFLASFLVLGLVRVLTVWVFQDPAAGLIEDQLWRTFLQVTDAGSVAEDGDSRWPEKLVGVGTILVGLVLFSSLVAFVTAEFEARLAELRKGRSVVIETGHTLLLGYGDRAVEIIRELIVANESEKDAAIVLLSDAPKDEMDDWLLERIPERLTTRIVTRSGTPSNLQTLRRMGVERAHAVIILNPVESSAPEEDWGRGDARVLKALMGVVASTSGGAVPPVVAELYLDRSRVLAEAVAPGSVTTLAEHEILARLLVQTSRTSGMAVVYGDLVGFTGREVYFFSPPGGIPTRPFGELLLCFDETAALGFRTDEGRILLNPPMDTVPGEGWEFVVLAEDDSTIDFRPTPFATPAPRALPETRAEVHQERQLLVGWTSKSTLIVEQYAKFLTQDSAIDIVVMEATPELTTTVAALREAYPEVAVQLIEGDARVAADLVRLKPETYDNVVLLAAEGDSAEEVDADTIALLLGLRQHMRDVRAQTGEPIRTQLITEVMDSDNTELVLQSGVKDFLISNQFVSKVLAQISQEPDVMKIYDDLFDPEGSEIYIKPIELYFDGLSEERPLDLEFADLVGAARTRNEVCFGWKCKAEEDDAERNFGVRLLPRKGSAVQLRPGDALILLAEDET
jgi:ion channel POLLUX/CASTOR